MKTLRKGFTLIELLIVIVIIGIIASIALPKFGDVKIQAYRSTVRSDLRTLQTQQELAFNQESNLTGYLPSLVAAAANPAFVAMFTPSQNVTAFSSALTPGAGFIGAVTHSRLSGITKSRCISVGVPGSADSSATAGFTTIAALPTMIQGSQTDCGNGLAT